MTKEIPQEFQDLGKIMQEMETLRLLYGETGDEEVGERLLLIWELFEAENKKIKERWGTDD